MSISETCTPATSSSTSPGCISPHSHAGPPLDTLPLHQRQLARLLARRPTAATAPAQAQADAIYSNTPRSNTCTTTTWHKGGLLLPLRAPLRDLAPRSFFLNLIPTPAKGTKRSMASSSSCVTRTKQRLATYHRYAHGRPGTAQPRNRETGSEEIMLGSINLQKRDLRLELRDMRSVEVEPAAELFELCRRGLTRQQLAQSKVVCRQLRLLLQAARAHKQARTHARRTHAHTHAQHAAHSMERSVISKDLSSIPVHIRNSGHGLQ